MIDITNTKIFGYEAAIRGMRNPMNSWDKSDSGCGCSHEYEIFGNCDLCDKYIGKQDYNLMLKLSKAGTDHAKFMRYINVTLDINAPLYWWKEFDTYKVGTVANSCSTMHKIHEKEFDRGDFSCEHIPLGSDAYSDTWDFKTSDMFFCINKEEGYYFSSEDVLDFTIQALNHYRNKYLETKVKPMKEESKRAELMKKYWWQMIQLLPSSYNQKRTIQLNYQVLKNIYHARKTHKLDEWIEFCHWIEKLPYSKLITEV